MSERNANPTRRALLGVAAAAGAALGAPWVRAQGMQKITISFPTRSGASWPLWIAKQAGLYARHGFDATLEFGVHPAGVAMLTSGQAQMINYGLEQILAASLREPAFSMMGSSLNKGSFALVGAAGLKRTEDLKGKRIGVGRLGDTLYVYTLDMIQKVGLTAQDVVWVPTGTDASARAKMLQAGQIDASLMVAPAYFRLEAAGFSVIDLIANHPDIFVSTAYVFKKSWVKDNADAPARLVMAHAEAIKRFYDDKDFAVAAYKAFDPQPDADIARVYDIYKSKDVLDRVPLLQKAAIGSAIQRMTGDVPGIEKLDAAQAVDMGPVRKLIADGWFRQLFGAGVAAEEQRKLAASY